MPAPSSNRHLPLVGSIMAIVDASDLARLRLIGRDFTAAVNRSTAGVARQMTGELARIIRTGSGGLGIQKFAPRHPISKILRGPYFGGNGKTAIPEKGTRGNYGPIGMWVKAGVQCIGFKTTNHQGIFIGQLLQTAEHRPLRPAERAYLRRRLGRGRAAALARTTRLNRPARPVFEPFAATLLTEYPKRLLERLNTEAARILRKRAKGATP